MRLQDFQAVALFVSLGGSILAVIVWARDAPAARGLPTELYVLYLIAVVVFVFGAFLLALYLARNLLMGPLAIDSNARGNGIDPTTKIIAGKKVQLATLVAGATDNTVRDKTFEDCEILGPIVVLPKGISFEDGSAFDNSSEEMIWEFPTQKAVRAGGVHVRDCHFRRCRFRDVAFAVTGEEAGRLRAYIQEARGEPVTPRQTVPSPEASLRQVYIHLVRVEESLADPNNYIEFIFTIFCGVEGGIVLEKGIEGVIQYGEYELDRPRLLEGYTELGLGSDEPIRVRQKFHHDLAKLILDSYLQGGVHDFGFQSVELYAKAGDVRFRLPLPRLVRWQRPDK